jgi:hypothetical protein
VCGRDEQTQIRDEWFEWFGPARGCGYGVEAAQLTHCCEGCGVV